MHLHARIRRHERSGHLADAHVQQGDRTRQPDDAARLGAGLVDRFLSGLRLHQHRLAVRVVVLADFGDRETPRRALDQTHAEAFLEQRDAPAQLRLGNPECPTRGSEAAVVDYRGKVIEVVQVLHRSIVLNMER